MNGNRQGLFLVGDIGVTTSHLTLLGPAGRELQSASMSSKAYPSLELLVQACLMGSRSCTARAVFAIAGPVTGASAHLTNLSWAVEANTVRDSLGFREVVLINDVEALALAVPDLGPEDLHTLSAGRPVEDGPVAVIAPGTGLGEAFLTWSDGRAVAHPSEGGHAEFAPADETQQEFLHFLSAESDHVGYERVASGSGLPKIRRFFRDARGISEPPAIEERLGAAEDPTPIIIEAAQTGASDLCVRTVETFASIVAAKAGNLALKILSTGGVFLGGGLPPHLLPFLERQAFLDAFCNRGRFTSLMEAIPIHVILQSHAALRGAARFATVAAERTTGW